MGLGILSHKRCCACSSYLPSTEFYKKGSRLDSRCKLCILNFKRKKRKVSARAKRRLTIRNIDTTSFNVFESPSNNPDSALQPALAELIEEILLGF